MNKVQKTRRPRNVSSFASVEVIWAKKIDTEIDSQEKEEEKATVLACFSVKVLTLPSKKRQSTT